jgi:hypothetical protein
MAYTRPCTDVGRPKSNPSLCLFCQLSDHRAAIVDLGRQPLGMTAVIKIVRYWRSLDVDAVTTDLLKSELFCALPKDVSAALSCYDTTLWSLVDRHVPSVMKRVRCRQSAHWYDGECDVMQVSKQRLQPRYRSSLTVRITMLGVINFNS